MIEAAVLFSDSDRFFLTREQIDVFTVPLGDRYDDEVFDGYFSVYAGAARRYLPKRILEIGTRFGTTGICMMLGLPVGSTVVFRSIDDESYDYGSCFKANRNFQEQVPWADAYCLHHNTFQGLPDDVRQHAPYDLIHIDGNHDKHGVLNDLCLCWPILADGGLILLDDATHPPIRAAIDEFLASLVPLQDVRVRHQDYADVRGHYFIQRARKRGRPRKVAE